MNLPKMMNRCSVRYRQSSARHDPRRSSPDMAWGDAIRLEVVGPTLGMRYHGENSCRDGRGVVEQGHSQLGCRVGLYRWRIMRD
jgi:hypothetical protein